MNLTEKAAGVSPIALSRGQMSKSGGNSIEIRKAKAETKLAQQNGLFLLTFAYGYSKIRV